MFNKLSVAGAPKPLLLSAWVPHFFNTTMIDNKENEVYHSILRDNGIFVFSCDVDEESCARCIEFILEANLRLDYTYDHLTLIINSRGGEIVDGFALIDIIQGSKIPVHTVGVGILASMGLMIFISGEKGNRILTPRTMVLSHQWSGDFCGKEHELLSCNKHNDLMSKMVLQHYKRCSLLKREKDIRKFLLPASDVWLSPQEALQFGLCDKIQLI